MVNRNSKVWSFKYHGQSQKVKIVRTKGIVIKKDMKYKRATINDSNILAKITDFEM